jgi:hypothetical protein
MGDWTVEQIATAIALMVAVVSGVTYLTKQLKDWIEKLLDSKFKDLNHRIDSIEAKVDKIDMEACKNFLVRFLADVENGAAILDSEKQRFWEEYKHYISAGGNSYIKEWVDKLKKKGLI